MAATETISQYLEGIDFPATKQDFIDYVERREAPKEVLDILEDLPEGTYYSMAALWDAVGEIE